MAKWFIRIWAYSNPFHSFYKAVKKCYIEKGLMGADFTLSFLIVQNSIILLSYATMLIMYSVLIFIVVTCFFFIFHVFILDFISFESFLLRYWYQFSSPTPENLMVCCTETVLQRWRAPNSYPLRSSILESSWYL